jgi:ribosomal protein S3
MGIFSSNKKEDLTPLLKEVKQEIRVFLSSNGQSRSELEITSIEIEPKKETNQYNINIKLCSVGRLIGKKGETISKLSNHLSSTLDKKFFINAVESELWK